MAGPIETYQEEFTRIEEEVDRGNTDLAGLGFWRLVRKVKAEPRLAVHWADEAGRIDRRAFEQRVRFRLPVWLGNTVLLVGSVVLAGLVPITLRIARDSQTPEPVLAGLLALGASAGMSPTLHDLAHWAVGRLVGIRFLYYFLDGPLRVQPGIKIDYASYMRASPGARAWMHASGALVSKVAPVVMFGAFYLPHRSAGYDLLPAWSMWAILGFAALQVLTDVIYSTRSSDWKKVRRELAVGRAQRI